MAQTVGGQVGPSGAADNTYPPFRQGRSAELIAQQLHGRYYESAYRRAIFNGAIVAQVTTVGLATTYTGLCLSNPIGSPVNLVLLKAGYGFTVAWAAVAAIGLMAGYNSGTNVTHTTPVTPRGNFFNGGSGGYGLLDSSATLPTAPTLHTVFNSSTTATAAVPPLVSGLVDFEGSLILPPGAYAAFFTSTVSAAASGHFSFSWEEVPV